MLLGTIQMNEQEVPKEFMVIKGKAAILNLFGIYLQLNLVLYVPDINKSVLLLNRWNDLPGDLYVDT